MPIRRFEVGEKVHVLVVCGYGCHLHTPLKPYLDRVVRFIQENKPDEVIFCGGFTQRKTADTSEALLMLQYVTDKLGEKNEGTFMYPESNSYTSLENIRQAAKIILSWHPINKLKITIFCEAQRAPNVIMLARHFMADIVESIDDITVETASWERADPFKQAYNMIYNRLAIRFPYLARRECQKRLRRAEFI